VPSANARNEAGENRDKTVFNLGFSSDPAKLKVYEFLGKLVGVASRNNVLVDLSLSALVWKPLVNEALSPADFFAVDVHLSKSLEWIQSGEADDDLLLEVLSSYVDSSVAAEVLQLVREMYEGDAAAKELCALILHLNYALHRRILSSLFKGLNCILPCELFGMFTAQELEVVFCGEPDVNVDLLQEATVYEGVSPTDR
jgi:E3 ubiquitin-protein ligase HUWE1